jgi:hypothetical protein
VDGVDGIDGGDETDAPGGAPDEQPPDQLVEDIAEELAAHDHPGRAELRPVDRWRRNTATGAVTAALALGFQHVFEPEKKDTIGIEQEAPTRPVDPDEVLELHFDPMNSQATSIVVRRPPTPEDRLPEDAQPDS